MRLESSLKRLVRKRNIALPGGNIMYVNRNDSRGKKLVQKSGNANPPSLAAWQALARERDWDFVIDVGANYGEMLLNLEPPRNTTTVIAIEPNIYVAACLLASLSRSRLPYLLVAGGASDESALIEVGHNRRSSGLVSTSKQTIQVAQVAERLLCWSFTIDELVSSLALKPLHDLSVLMKIDVEGNEQSVLDGASEVLQNCSKVAVMVEVIHSAVEVPGYETSDYVYAESQPSLIQDVVLRKRETS